MNTVDSGDIGKRFCVARLAVLCAEIIANLAIGCEWDYIHSQVRI